MSATTTGLTTNRRSFLKWGSALGAGGAALAAVGAPITTPGGIANAAPKTTKGTKTVWSACTVNCGSRCPLRLEVSDEGVVTRVLPDNTGDDTIENRSVRACVRGRSIRQRMYSPHRIKTPMKRKPGTRRGDGQWIEITWEQALDEVADKITQVRKEHGPEAVHVIYGTGTTGGNITRRNPMRSLLAKTGGYLYYQADYSTAQITSANPYMYGGWVASNSLEDARHSRLQVMFGNNGLETRMSGGGETFVTQQTKKESGVRTIVIDPRYSETALGVGDEWIPLRPGTDGALCAALAYVMITENLVDQAFLDKYTIGYDEEHMPEGIPAGNSYKSYILGQGPVHKTPRTPQWASKITGIPVATIERLAREIAHAKPCAITQGWGPQRHANGENTARAIFMIPILTGNVGISGGGTGGREGYYGIPIKRWGEGENPCKTTIPVFMWTEAIRRGHKMTATNAGVKGAEKLGTDVKVIVAHASNTIMNQHSNSNKTAELLRDDTKCEMIVNICTTMDASARFSDILLPDAMSTEQADLVPNGSAGEMGYLIYTEAAGAPAHNTKSTYEILRELARRWGVDEEWSENKTQEQWRDQFVEESREKVPEIPADLEQLRRQGVVRQRNPKGYTIPFKDFREDPEANPLKTPSGKIEIFSQQLWEMAKTWTWEFASADGDGEEPLADPSAEGHVITALPEYVATWEDQERARAEGAKYPLQLIGHHYKGRTHSTYGECEWLVEAHTQVVWINPIDARQALATQGKPDGARTEVKTGDTVRVYNDRGVIELQAFVTPRIAPGTVSVPQGAWYTPNSEGVDVGGNVNTLTSWVPSPLAKGNAQHTALVAVSLAKRNKPGSGVTD